MCDEKINLEENNFNESGISNVRTLLERRRKF